VARRKVLDLVQRHGIVPADDRNAAQLAHIPREVVDERVVVVDDEDHALMTFYHTFLVRRAGRDGAEL
jgi:hypothetical protein